ncbi:hypothetical protein F53441_887 [Fusarium austroafricanum]|uniref:Uncharacterized protein n=1 Tax=Fusarium austroafricanum TaxID=2364996 RepID=A0A8H4KWS0_9HYPO|nr:hypothetical protein F53441_887 [Fusarium austroafricanum]
MTDIKKLLSDSAVSADDAAQRLAGPALEALQNDQGYEDKLNNLWLDVFTAAEQTPHGEQGKLVETLQAIKNMPQANETGKKIVVWGEETQWNELPMFGGLAREQLDVAQEKSHDSYVNVNGFFARVTAAGVNDLSLFGLWAMRDALEDPAADKIAQQTSPMLLNASLVWMIYASGALAQASRNGKQFDGKIAKPGASLAEFKDEAGWRGFCNDRWKIWQDRLSDLNKAGISAHSKSLLTQALESAAKA